MKALFRSDDTFDEDTASPVKWNVAEVEMERADLARGCSARSVSRSAAANEAELFSDQSGTIASRRLRDRGER